MKIYAAKRDMEGLYEKICGEDLWIKVCNLPYDDFYYIRIRDIVQRDPKTLLYVNSINSYRVDDPEGQHTYYWDEVNRVLNVTRPFDKSRFKVFDPVEILTTDELINKIEYTGEEG